MNRVAEKLRGWKGVYMWKKSQKELQLVKKDPHLISRHTPSEVIGNESGPLHTFTFDPAKEKENEV